MYRIFDKLKKENLTSVITALASVLALVLSQLPPIYTFFSGPKLKVRSSYSAFMQFDFEKICILKETGILNIGHKEAIIEGIDLILMKEDKHGNLSFRSFPGKATYDLYPFDHENSDEEVKPKPLGSIFLAQNNEWYQYLEHYRYLPLFEYNDFYSELMDFSKKIKQNHLEVVSRLSNFEFWLKFRDLLSSKDIELKNEYEHELKGKIRTALSWFFDDRIYLIELISLYGHNEPIINTYSFLINKSSLDYNLENLDFFQLLYSPVDVLEPFEINLIPADKKYVFNLYNKIKQQNKIDFSGISFYSK